MLDKLKTAIVLVIIGAISGFLIWGTNEITAEGIADNNIAREQAYYADIFEVDGNIDFNTTIIDATVTEEVEIFDATGASLGFVYKGSETNNYGDITVLVGITNDGTIKNVVISGTTNTPTFVKKITANYLDPFVGQSTDDVEYDERTGASFTYGSVTKMVEAASMYYQENRGDE